MQAIFIFLPYTDSGVLVNVHLLLELPWHMLALLAMVNVAVRLAIEQARCAEAQLRSKFACALLFAHVAAKRPPHVSPVRIPMHTVMAF